MKEEAEILVFNKKKAFLLFGVFNIKLALKKEQHLGIVGFIPGVLWVEAFINSKPLLLGYLVVPHAGEKRLSTQLDREKTTCPFGRLWSLWFSC